MIFWNMYCTYGVIFLLGYALITLCEGYANKHKNKKDEEE